MREQNMYGYGHGIHYTYVGSTVLRIFYQLTYTYITYTYMHNYSKQNKSPQRNRRNLHEKFSNTKELKVLPLCFRQGRIYNEENKN